MYCQRLTHLVSDVELLQDVCERLRKIDAGVGARDLDEVKRKREGLVLVDEVYRNGDIRMVVGSGPRVRGEVQIPVVVL